MAEVSEPLNPLPNPSPERVSVLLLDERPDNLLSLRAILDDLGQHLVEARSAEEALERLKVNEFAVVLLGVRMAGFSGFDLAKRIRADERTRHTPIIFLTADDSDRAQVEEGYALGAVDFLVTPLSPVAVRAKVQGFVQLFQDKQQVKEEAEQLRLLVHGTTDYAIFMLDPQGRIATWNAGAERLKGYRAEEIIGQHFSRFYPQEAIDRGWPAHELKVAAAEGRFEDEGWRLRKDGSQFWANVVITALRDDRGRLRGFSKITRDLTERKQAEESLRRSEERFRHMIEGVYDYAIFMLDPQGNVVTWNAGAERIKGYKAEEIIGQHFSRFYPQEAIDRGWPAHELKVAAAEGRFEDEGWRLRKDGSQFWANVVITAVKDSQSRLLGFTKVTRDLTARKQAEENARRLAEEAAARRVAEENARLIQEQRERLHVTLASIGDAVISTDAQGRVDFLNPVAEELTGWRSGEAAGKPLEDVFRIVNEHTRQPVENPVARVLKEGRAVGLANHTVLLRRDGTERPIDDSAAPIKAADGSTLGVVLVFRDVTEQRRAQREARRNEALLTGQKRVLELLVQGEPLPDVLDGLCEVVERQNQQKSIATVLLVDGDGQRLRSVGGRRAPAVYAGAVDGLRIGPCAGSCGTAAYRGEPVVVADIASDPLWAVAPDLRDLALRHGLRACWSTPIVSTQGRVLGTFAVYYSTPRRPSADEMRLVDILTRTAGVAIERRRDEEALKEADRRKDEFLATLAHELRNPMAPLRNGLQLLKLTDDPAAREQAREMMDRQLGQMVRLVDDLLDISRITRNKLEMRKARIDLSGVIRSAIETARPQIEARGHTLTVTLPPTPVSLDGDLTRLAQVFWNLLNNSAKYTEPGGKIALTAEVQDGEAVVTVQDNGIGIPAAYLPNLFEMFSQVDRNLERAEGGLGIGLALVKGLTEAHGGSVEVMSEGVSHGSMFIVRLPVASVSTPPETKESPDATQSRPRHRILVVDDNRDGAASLAMLLTVMGNETRTAHDGLEGVQMAEAFRPDLIVLDIGLPKLNGYDACRRIREQAWAKNTIIVAATGWGQDEDRRRSHEAGFDCHLVKPVDAAEVIRLLAKAGQ